MLEVYLLPEGARIAYSE